MIKFLENAIWPIKSTQYANISLGGCDGEGNDLANELSFILLNAQLKIRGNAPLLSVRWHRNINREFWLLAHRCIRDGSGIPGLFSDEALMASLQSWGIPKKDITRYYGIVGCVEPSLRGKMHGSTLGGHLNLAKCLELALNNGRAFITGKQLGPDMGNLTNYHDIEQLLHAYEQQVKHAVLHNTALVTAAAEAQRECFSYPLMSALMHGGISHGRDLIDGVSYNMPTISIYGVSNVVDSCFALEYVMFRQKKYSAEEILDALRNNFENREEMRLILKNEVHKFGNGISEVTQMYTRICEIHKNIVEKYSGPRGDHFKGGIWPVMAHVRLGKKTGALPSGRLAGAPLVDGVGSSQGCDLGGPTILAMDVAEIDAVKYWPAGNTLNMRFDQSSLMGENNLQKFADFTYTFFAQGGMQMQINTESAETLKEAQKNPEKYSNLVVRVAGFSAYFIGLDESVQDEIISRTTHRL
jgi:formate C-acetyltransferase